MLSFAEFSKLSASARAALLRTSVEDVMYHVAPSGQRSQIQIQGLDGGMRRYVTAPRPFSQSVYVFGDLGNAEEWARLETTNSHHVGPHDIWEVSVQGLNVRPDEVELGMGVENSYVIEGAVAPDRLRFLGTWPLPHWGATKHPYPK